MPTIGSPTWGQKINGDFQILDATVNVYGANGVSTNTITAGSNITIGTTSIGVIISATGGGSGGSSALGVNYNGVSITTPTAQINFTGPDVVVVANGSTATVSVGPVSLSSGVEGVLPSTGVVLTSSGIAFGSPLNVLTNNQSSFWWNNTLDELFINGPAATVPEQDILTWEANGTVYGKLGYFSSTGNNFGVLDVNNFFELYSINGGGIILSGNADNLTNAVDDNEFEGNLGIGNGQQPVNRLDVAGAVSIGYLPTAWETEPTNSLVLNGQLIVAGTTTINNSVVINSSLTIGGAGDGSIVETLEGSTYTVTSTSVTFTGGHLAVWGNTTNYTLVDGGAPGSGGGGTPAGSNLSLQYNNGGSFGGAANTSATSSSMTIAETMVVGGTLTVSNATNVTSSNLHHALLDLYQAQSSNGYLFNIGSANQTDQVYFQDMTPANFVRYGIQVDGMYVGANTAPESLVDTSLSSTQRIDLNSSGNINIQTTSQGNGGKNIYLNPNTVTEVAVSSLGVTLSTSVTVTGTMTVTGAQGLGVTYQVSAGSYTGAGLTSCSGVSNALTWTSSTEQFGCNTISGGSGGASTLAVYTGTAAQMLVSVSSPTAVLNLDESTLSGALEGGATAYISVTAGISNPTGNFTIGSTSTVILANCGSACTITLPTAIGIGGKRFAIKQMSSVATGQVTVNTTSSQTIDGNSSYAISITSATLDLISDNANWQIE